MIKFVLPVLTGAVIGYITNWIAIKMLFRPHNEIRVFNVKIPFTPGVIPKEKGRIAKSIGTTVNLHLLNKDVFREALSSDDVKNRLKNSLIGKIEEISGSGQDAGDIYAGFTGENKEDAALGAKNKICQYAGNRIETFVLSFLEDLSDVTGKETIKGLLKKGSDKMLPDERMIINILPDKFFDAIGEYISNNREAISETLNVFISKPSTIRGLNDFITHILKSNKNKLINTLINPDFITVKLLEALSNYVKDPGNHDKICEIIFNLIKKAFTFKVKEAGGFIAREEIVEVLGEQGFLLIKSEVGVLADDFFKNGGFDHTVNKLIDAIFRIKVSDILAKLNKEKTADLIIQLYEKHLIDKIILAVESLNLEKIIEDKINTFDFQHLEDLIQGLAKKELGAITKLGALLGAVMGALFTLFDKLI